MTFHKEFSGKWKYSKKKNMLVWKWKKRKVSPLRLEEPTPTHQSPASTPEKTSTKH